MNSIRGKLLISMLSLMSIMCATLTYVQLHSANQIIFNSIITTVIFLGICFIIIVFLSTKISKPIIELTNSVRLLTTGNFSAKMPLPRFGEQDEVSVLVTTFAQMAKKFKRSYRQLEDQNLQLEQNITERTSELNHALENLTGNLEYVRLIQLSLLPNMQQVKTYLPKSFLIWQPKDVVGGDMLYIDLFQDDFIVALVDCSGEGVPSAFLSMIAATSLKKITRDEGCHIPGEILSRLNVMVKTLLQQYTGDAKSDNGLDAAICWIKPSEKTLFFAGAKLPLYYIANEQLNIIAGEKHCLGYQTSNVNFKFTTHLVKIEKSISFYMSTDGFLVQPGGLEHLPFGHKRFRQLLMENNQLAFEEQSESMLKKLNEYKGASESANDVTVVGFNLEYKQLSPTKKRKTARDFIILPKKVPKVS